MKIVLLQDDKKLGKKGTLVDVADGYATSALIPMGKAKPATQDIIAQVKRAEKNHEQEKIDAKKAAQEMAQKLHNAHITIAAKSEGTKIFGSIGARDIAEAVKKEYNLVIDDKVADVQHIKELGTRTVALHLGHGVSTKMTVEIVAA